MQNKLIIFDFDGVLVDTLLVCHSIDSEINGIASLEEYKSFFNGNIFEAKRANKKTIVPDPEFAKRYDERTREIVVPAEMKNIVASLGEKNMLAIVSSTPTASIEKVLVRENIGHHFLDILGSDVHLNKAIKIQSLLVDNNVLPKDVIFITDTVGDVREGKACGVSSIAVTWGFQKRAVLEESKPFAVVDTPLELAEAVARFFAST